MLQEQIHSQLKQKYYYESSGVDQQHLGVKYKIFKGTQKQLNISVSIKIAYGNNYQASLIQYLQKLKSIKSQYVIKIYEIIYKDKYLVVVTQQVNYGTLYQALINCKKLDQQDSIYLLKYLLNGHVDILRAGLQWNGNLNDVDVTQNGIKFSWNNTLQIKQSLNSIKLLMQQISSEKLQQNQQRLLPNPQNKQILQLIKLSQTTPSQISLNQQMKKKQKYIKKKFKQYFIIKQIKSHPQYFEQTLWLAISKEHGFVKIKSYQKGTIRQTILQLNKTKTTFTKVIQTIEQHNKLYIVSIYSNGGTLQSYVSRLKSAGILLKQDQIQFFFYSLFQPLKLIQESSLKSLNISLHIKNIYIENGIPKIGEPVPLNIQVEQRLIEKADVPDFYHPEFKKNPKTYDPSFDTYSLGVLLYKLMYTEYPIFPNNKVHIPTTPTYNNRLKKTLEIFLNQGGRLSQIQKRIQVSETVLKQVKKNKQQLINDKKIVLRNNNKITNNKSRYLDVQDIDIENDKLQLNISKEQKDTNNENDQNEPLMDDCFDCCVNIQDLVDGRVDPSVQSLEQSPYKVYRHITKLIVMLLIWVLVLYLYYLKNNFNIMRNFNNISLTNITISTVKYEIVTFDINEFYLQFNQTTKLYKNLQQIGCMVNSNKTIASNMVYNNSIKWISFIIGGLILLILIMVMKGILVFKFDYIKMKFNYQHGYTNYNYSNYIIINLIITSLINHHFYFFNSVFYTSFPSCLGTYKSRIFSHTYYLFTADLQFLYVNLPVLIAYFILALLHFVMVVRTDKIKYSKLFNPIFMFLPFLLAYWIAVRIGVLSYDFYPNSLRDQSGIIVSYFKQLDYIGIIGIVPEILFVIQFAINMIIDMFYWLLIDKKRRIMIINQSSTENIRLTNL